jgi:hypothetical protein
MEVAYCSSHPNAVAVTCAVRIAPGAALLWAQAQQGLPRAGGSGQETESRRWRWNNWTWDTAR